MWLFEVTLALLLASALAVAFTPKLRLPLELILLLGSILVSLIPGVPRLHLESDAVFYILLPPILFAAAYFTSWHEFKKNIRPISMLAVGLVLFTTLGIGYGLHLLFPEIPLPAAILLGAIVSPPDASAATAVAHKLGLPRRLLTIIEGESLINDASALVCYRFAVAAIMSGSFSLGEAVGRFAVVAAGGMAAGIVIGFAGIWLIRRLKNSTAETLLSLVTSFIAYLIAERLHVSGVISTVAAGVIFGRRIPQQMSAETRFEAAGAWNTTLLSLNGIIFALMGLQLPHVIGALAEADWSKIVLCSVTVVVLLIALRFTWIFPVAYLTRLIPAVKRKDPLPPRSILFVLSWTGMRGIVSLAAALSIPETLPSGEPFPFRALIIFITYVVILVTLVLPTVTLPVLVRLLKISAGDESFKEGVAARIRMTDSVLTRLTELEDGKHFDGAQLSPIRERYERFRRRIAPNLEEGAAFSLLDFADQSARNLSQELVRAERKALIELRVTGEIHDEVFHQLNNELDVEELRILKFSHPL